MVTGGAGFIGSHLCEKLLELENHVISIDNYFSGNKANISNLIDHPNFESVRHDITSPIHIEVDEIYNFACPASPVYYQHNSIHTVKTCVMGAVNMLDLARDVRAKIMQASTSEIYGDPLLHPQKENYFGNVNIIGPRSCYDEGKRVAETLFFDYHRQYEIDIRVIRIFNTYGPKMSINDGRVVSNFIVQALRGEDITIYGNGMQTRSFCYIDDLITGIVSFMNNKNETGPVNLGNPTEFTMLELANLVINLTDSKSKIVFYPLPENDPMQRRPDINKAKKLIDFNPSIKLEDGLRRTIEYFKKIV